MEGMANKFLVVKLADIEKHLTHEQQIDFWNLLVRVSNGRTEEGKPDNTYLVVNTDESYADEVADILKRNGHWG